MRHLLIAFAAAAGLAIAQPVHAQASSANVAETLEDAGKWMLQINDALEISGRAYQEVSPKVQALSSAPMRSPAEAKAVGTRIRALIAPLRTALQQSNAALDRIEPPPSKLEQGFAGMGLSGQQIIAEARQQNASLERLFNAADGMGAAIAQGNRERTLALASVLMQGAPALLDNQALLLRNRQLLVPANEVTHQALGVQRVLYSGMSVLVKAAVFVQTNPGKTIDLSQARTELNKLAQNVARYGMDGRGNLAREKADMAQALSLVDRSATADQKSAIRRMQAAAALEEETFAIADDLHGLLRKSAGQMTQAQVAAGPFRALLQPYEHIETRLADITRRQAQALAGVE